MISFAIDSRYVQDLEDDFIMNEDRDLYKFINNDPVRAFYLGYNITKWFDYIDKKQKYLYSKQVRHNKDDLEKYQKQIEFWANKYKSPESEINMATLAEFIINNMFWEEGTEDLDRVKLAFFFGNTIAEKEKQQNSSNE